MNRPLVVRFGALGDMVLMTVPIRILSERFGCPVDVLGSGAWTKPLLSGQAGVGNIALLGSRKMPYWLARDQQRLVRWLRERGPGPTWLFDARNDKTRRLLERAGWEAHHLTLQQRVPDIAGEHFCDRWRRFALLNPPDLGDVQYSTGAGAAIPDLRVSPEARAEALQWLQSLGVVGGPFILIQVGNKRTMRRRDRRRRSNTKYWPEENWASVLSTLRALHPDHALLLLGVAPEAPLNDEILAMARLDRAYNLAREMSVPRLMGLAECAAGMISVDTGPAHIAAALGCPLLTMFDSEAKVRMYAPRGPKDACRRLVVSADERPSMLRITIQQVLAEWRGMVLRPSAQFRDVSIPETGSCRALQR